MSLGLGELSAELLCVAPIATAETAALAACIRREPRVLDLDAACREGRAAASAEAIGSGDEAIDLRPLLESLDQTHDDASTVLSTEESVEHRPTRRRCPRGHTSWRPPSSSPPRRELPADSYIGGDVAGRDRPFWRMTDELSALTGADRPARPVVTLHGSPTAPFGVLKRDTRVDKDTLLKIIDGIKNL